MKSRKQNITYKQEVYRKLFHLTSLWIPISYYFTDYEFMFWLLLVVTSLVLIIDFGKNKIKLLHGFVQKFMGPIMRSHESGGQLSGASYMMLSALLCLMLFPEVVVIVGFSILIISDSVAAIIGRKWGKTKIYTKSLEGSFAFFVSSVIVVLLIGHFLNMGGNYYMSAINAALVATLAELFAKDVRVDDNFLIPVSFGIVMMGFGYVS